MLGTKASAMRRMVRAATILATGLVVLAGPGMAAKAETRTLRLQHVHLGEKSVITYKRNGKYLAEGLKQANWALRDWRENKPTRMDPALLDIMWELQQQSGTRDYIQVLGGYRSPKTNNMLRSRSSGVAGGSLHMSGKAIDFYTTDVPLRRLREIGLKLQLGGVGYYPRSGSPFVHFDSGNGRYWPRMSRSELAKIFPRGNTIYLPSDGKPLPGYEQAMASYNRRKGAAGDVQIASAGETRRGKSLLARIFGGGNDEAEDNAEMEAAPTPAPRRTREPARQAPQPAPTPEPEIAIASIQPTPAPRRAAAPQPAAPVAAALPSGMAMPDRPQFDTSSRAPTPAAGVPTPSAGIPAAPPPAAEPAAVAVANIPMPRSAPARAVEPQPAPVEVAAVAEPASAAGELAYAVPTPSRRPFAAVLQAAATPRQDAVPAPDAIADAILSASVPERTASAAEAELSVPVAHPTPRMPSAVEEPVLETADAAEPATVDAADAAEPAMASDAPATDEPAAHSTLLAALETPQPAPRQVVEDAVTAAAEAPAIASKGGRIGSSDPDPLDEAAITSRIATATEITQPLQVAELTGGKGERLSPSMLVVNVPVAFPSERFGPQ